MAVPKLGRNARAPTQATGDAAAAAAATQGCLLMTATTCCKCSSCRREGGAAEGGVAVHGSAFGTNNSIAAAPVYEPRPRSVPGPEIAFGYGLR